MSDNETPDQTLLDIIDDYQEFASFTCPIPPNSSSEDLIVSFYLHNQTPVFPVDGFFQHDKCLVGLDDYPHNKPVTVDHKSYYKIVLTVEFLTALTAAVVVNSRLLGVIGGSVIGALASFGISQHYENDELVDSYLHSFGKFSQGFLKHATFYEIATHPLGRDIFKKHVLPNVADYKLKYLLDILYFAGGNVVANWVADSLIDVQNELILDKDCEKVKIPLEPFIKKKMPFTVGKRIIKEIAKDGAIFSVINFEEPASLISEAHSKGEMYLQFRTLQSVDDPSIKFVRTHGYELADSSTIPSLIGHFSANALVTTWYNGFNSTMLKNVFLHSVFKYVPEVISTCAIIYFKSDYPARHPFIFKYSTILITTGSYMLGKYMFPNN